MEIIVSITVGLLVANGIWMLLDADHFTNNHTTKGTGNRKAIINLKPCHG